jgi:hypothetical protein
MPNPYKARVDVRRFLNLPGFHGGAYVVAYVEDTSSRQLTKRDPFGYEGSRYINPQPRIILEIADCSNRINLEFELDFELDVENSLHKVDVLAAALAGSAPACSRKPACTASASPRWSGSIGRCHPGSKAPPSWGASIEALLPRRADQSFRPVFERISCRPWQRTLYPFYTPPT